MKQKKELYQSTYSNSVAKAYTVKYIFYTHFEIEKIGSRKSCFIMPDLVKAIIVTTKTRPAKTQVNFLSLFISTEVNCVLNNFFKPGAARTSIEKIKNSLICDG